MLMDVYVYVYPIYIYIFIRKFISPGVKRLMEEMGWSREAVASLGWFTAKPWVGYLKETLNHRIG